ncbi:hypothetical protein GGI12_004536 [Dipsacomyces acuminosporus]|nr:hypothetical protein GGI12_004536 [Dipsacomyces acuminosporus]
MIDPDDINYFSWAQDTSLSENKNYVQYSFLGTMPLYAKRELFRTMNSIIGDFSMPDIFREAEQRRWAGNVVSLGMQLPIEDVDLMSDSFEQYQDILFVLHRLEHDEVGYEDRSETRESFIKDLTLAIISRPRILFNPHVFFRDQLPTRVLTRQINKQATETPESCMNMLHKTPSAASSKLTPSYFEQPQPAQKAHSLRASSRDHIQLADIGNDSGTKPPGTRLQSVESTGEGSSAYLTSFMSQSSTRRDDQSRYASDIDPQQDAARGMGAKDADDHYNYDSKTADVLHDSHMEHRISRAVELWEQYVELLSRVLQVYSTVIRGLKPSLCREILQAISMPLVLLADLVLSQGGNNPLLRPWIDRYRPHIGPEIWDRTWATIGDRLENFAIKLVLDIWSRLINWAFLTKFTYWLHRPLAMKVWMHMLSQVQQHALQSFYPADSSVGTDKIYVRLAELTIVCNVTGDITRRLLHTYPGCITDPQALPSSSFYEYANGICSLIYRALDVELLVDDGERWCEQRPPTANYLLHYFGNILFGMALRKDPLTKNYVIAKRNAITALCRLLRMAQYPDDPLSSENHNRILYVIYEAIQDSARMHTMLPNAAFILRGSPYPVKVPSVLDQDEQRLHAMHTLSSLIGFFGYYHEIGKTQMIANTKHPIQSDIDILMPKSLRHSESVHRDFADLKDKASADTTPAIS